jgi:hypothetical protein
VREDRVVLEHHAEVPPVRRNPVHRPAADDDGTGILFEEAGHHAQKRRLPAAGRAEEGDEFSASGRQVDAAECGEVPEPLRHARHPEVGGRGGIDRACGHRRASRL